MRLSRTTTLKDRLGDLNLTKTALETTILGLTTGIEETIKVTRTRADILTGLDLERGATSAILGGRTTEVNALLMIASR